MADPAKVILSGFSDEAAADKTLDQQFSAFAALGLRHFSLRFVDAGNGVKNILQLSDAEVAVVRNKMTDYGLRVSSIGSPIGKVKLFEFEDGTSNRHVEPKEYLEREVHRACEMAQAFDTRLIRGFSFYPPRDSDPASHIGRSVERLRDIVHACDRQGLTFGLEVEANLVGCNGWLLAEIHRRVNHPALVLVFDGANLRVQGYSTAEIYEQYLALKPGLGWLHVKDYRNPRLPPPGKSGPNAVGAHVDESRLDQFVPVGMGESAYPQVFNDLREFLPTLRQRLAPRQIDDMFLELEPHLKAGGQFGGFSGPDGFGVALRHLGRLLDSCGIGYDLLEWEQMTGAANMR